MPSGFFSKESMSSRRKPLSKPQRAEVAKIALRTSNRHAETKLIVTPQAAIGFVANTAQIADLNAIGQGLTQNTRVGLQIEPIGFKAKVSFTLPGNGLARVIIFQWHPDSAASAPVVGSVLDIGTGGVAPDVHSFHNWFNRSQYTILYDKTQVSTVQATQEVFFEVNIKKKLRFISYNSGAAITTGENHLHYLMITETAATMNQVSETRFKDQ